MTYQAKLNDIELRFKSDIAELRLAPLPKAKSKAVSVRSAIQLVKLVKPDITLLALLGNKVLVTHIAEEAELKPGLCRQYLRNNWNKA